ncbi:GH36-type glycosyl hydrolase domain-containing protein [Yoonia sediminilitoris]|uniref:Cyclic beta-1,2-glucan synthetase n=1 Tax=Yoonia sediminilitoris TaxID=1286148 RepID=A0A2T6KC44_9RHOB|nr:glucoamylase family protein [Yoonia sediminilitoris]PUB12428.1 cyclic beta-1,2-glucan synthetase [Yoonia sediminilitoris]RCW93122.1 cyclic beta-1,2-glucan synthetase [Yoonia sediminilitoris]
MNEVVPPQRDVFPDTAALATEHTIASGPPALLACYRALPDLDDWFDQVRSFCADPPTQAERAAEWILDNDYQIIRALRRLKEGLPRHFYDKLPALAEPDGPGTPRVFAVARAALDQIDKQLTLEGLAGFVLQYQKTSELTNGELWAMPSMLRLACMTQLVAAVGQLDPDLVLDWSASAGARPQDAAQTVERISTAITDLIVIDTIKWADFVDQVSCIEAALKTDPAAIYAGMTFETRNRYRDVVETLAIDCDLAESEIARRAVALGSHEDAQSRRHHVGYWLIDAGRQELEVELGFRAPRRLALQRSLSRATGWLYAAGLVALAFAAVCVSMVYLWSQGASPGQWVLGVAISILPATIPSVWFGHWVITRLSKPDVLPEMDFAEAIPQDCGTAILIPVIVADSKEVRGILEKIEILRLANPDPAFRFVLLSDLADARTQTLATDAEIEQALKDGIETLNSRYRSRGPASFMLLHRRRTHNPAEGIWMARERKRGKLDDFNRFVLREGADAFDLTAGAIETLRGIPYAITLDADTQMPPGAAARLVGILAHPLNRAVVDPRSRRVVSGHAILQPRIEILPKLGKGTHFTHLYGGDTAIDIYSRAVSDVYQDLFGTGIFVGKGIYDIAALHRSVEGRIPDNHILSHDLFEGLHGRAALVSNVVLYEDLPATYPEFALRQHRWMRGDWQLLPWLGRRVPVAAGDTARTTLSTLDRWKLIDNLRRSLMSPALLVFFLAGWLVLPGSALVWTVLAVAAPGSYLIGELFAVATGGIRKGAFGSAVHKIQVTAGRWFFLIVFLVTDTVMALDAIFRSLWRVYVSGRNRLEWTSAAHAAAKMSDRSIRNVSWRLMWPSTAFALVISAHLALFNPQVLWPALPVLFLWLIAPELSVWSARARFFRAQTLTDGQRAYLKRAARQTWHFFETFAGPEENWLPPDNYQFGHVDEVAHRTSPTNIGMFLVSALAAKDMGFVTTSDFLARSRHTLHTLTRMEHYRGHILNWYDTRTLEPLEPHYVSTVDSGNLAVSLITLKQGCLEQIDQPPLTAACFDGLRVTLDLLGRALHEADGADLSHLTNTQAKIATALDDAEKSPLNWADALARLGGTLWPELEAGTRDVISAVPDLSENQLMDITTWLSRFHHGLHAISRDIETYMPWLSVLDAGTKAKMAPALQLADLLRTEMIEARTPSTPDLICDRLEAWQKSHPDADQTTLMWLDQLRDAASAGRAQQDILREGLRELALQADAIAFGMDFKFLYDPAVRLFSIGYNRSLGRMDGSHYDLLATEARLASYFAIAKHDAPIEHWFAFSRPITRLKGKPSILSWNGSIFEYLMPPLFLPSYRDTLLGESELTAIDFQRDYARARNVPWGISESAFGTTDTRGVFQYRAFGVPALGIRRGLTDDLVIAPYGAALALCGWPGAAVDNLQALAQMGAQTRYGFIEALDFTSDRMTPGDGFVPVTTFMAHHQGMVQVAIANALLGDIMVQRFLNEKAVKAMDLLLQERVPWDVPLELGRADEVWDHPADKSAVPALAAWVPSPDFPVHHLHVLGNGRMSSFLTESGGGGLTWKDTALTRWWPDPTRNAHGIWMYLQDADSNDLWSLGAAPTAQSDDDTRCVFHPHMVELLRRHDGIVARMDITVAAEDDVEIRRVTLVNESGDDRTIDITSCGEVVLAPPLDDERHPAFSKLFVHSSYLADAQALLFTRRPRRPETRPPVLLHKLVSADPDIRVTAWESDRHNFVGRNQSDRNPQGLQQGLSQSAGWTLDPVMSLQTRVSLKPMETRQLVFLTVAATSDSEALHVANRYPMGMIDHAFRDALSYTGHRVHRLGIASEHLPELQVLSSLLVHVHPTFRRPAPLDKPDWNGQPDLWRYGISGDDPILLLKVSDPETSSLLSILVRGHSLWRQMGLHVDLVIMQDAAISYQEPLRERVLSIISETHAGSLLGMRGGIHLLSGGQMSEVAKHGIEAAARVILRDENKSLRDVLDRVLETREAPTPFGQRRVPPFAAIPAVKRPHTLLFDNGYGGFDPENGDYLLHLAPGMRTPAPWINILANDDFGCLVSEAGFGATWAVNSGEHRLTPWSNDPVTERPGEAMYLRDEASGAVWTTTPQPMGQGDACAVRHGMGFTRWRKNSHGLEQALTCFVPVDASVKLVRLTLTNKTDQPRRITATYYAEWLLGALGSVSQPHVTSRYDTALKAIVGRNPWNPEFAARAAFLTATQDPHSITGARHDFLGRDGDVFDPEALRSWDLGGHFPQGGDACAAYQVHLDIAPGARTEVVFALGEVATADALPDMVARWQRPDAADRAFATLQDTWARRLGAAQVATPDPAFDLMVNKWLPYQNRSSRIMARAGFYQAGGAFGFRDQLQDVLALLLTEPARARAQILLAAQHQFEQGDVLHWWHPPEGRGVRTRCSDDYLWLVYVTGRYVQATGDMAILDAQVPFLSAPELRPEEDDRYALFDTGATGSLFDHCASALDLMIATGAHRLPLMGSGDWNDGMDRIGAEGRGESIWLAWFQIGIVEIFAPLARQADRADDANRWQAHADHLIQALRQYGWDGAWYLRAFDDDGIPWGSSENDECQIDLIAQAWSVLSGQPFDDRARLAMRSAHEKLVDPDARLIRLLTPPFDISDRNPGYIQAYPPGIRENGGQYTHAATWLGMAYAKIKDGDHAYQVFDLLNPIARTGSTDAADQYRREPYVLAGDVSGTGGLSGRGGWSWYSGAAGWAWQLGVCGILGVEPVKDAVRLAPCLPKAWGHAAVVIDGAQGRLEIDIRDPDRIGQGQTHIIVDGQAIAGELVSYPGKGRTSKVVVTLCASG